VLAVRWYLRFGLSYRDVEELLAERGIEVDHVTIYRWVQRFTPLLADAARFCRHAVGHRWFVDETYVKVCGHWRYVYRAVDQFGQVVDVYVSTRRDGAAARRFFARALATTRITPVEVVTDRTAVYLGVVEELLPRARHDTAQYANNRVEADHSQLKRWLRPMRGLKSDLGARTVITGHAFIRNIRRGFYELGVDEPVLWGAITLPRGRAGLLRGPFVLGDQPAEDGSALDPFVGQVDAGTVGSWGLQREGPVWSSSVVMTHVFIERSA